MQRGQTSAASVAVDPQTQAHEDDRGNPTVINLCHQDNPLDSPTVLCLEGLVWEGGAKMDRTASRYEVDWGGKGDTVLVAAVCN